MKLIFDTNFLIDLARFRIGFEEIENLGEELLTLNSVVKELEKIASSKGKNSKNAKIALKLIELKNIRIIKSKEKNVDKGILKLAKKNTLIATNDRKLRKILKKRGIKTIYLRKKKKIAVS
jgi:rRNA-processing protein FCF1